MLTTLRVKNFAIVENVRVAFDRGLNVITGETGAGKSILVGALGLVLGDRADKGMIRTGEDKCGVEASFELIDSSAVNSVLDELGIDPCDEGHLIIRRIISASGAGKCLVNDCPATLQALKKIGILIVDMHGPHEHQSLLSRAFQLDLLDSFGQIGKDRSLYEVAYGQMQALEKQRGELDCDDEDVTQQIDMLSFQVKEIDDADLANLDEDELEREHTMTANAQQILSMANGISRALAEDDRSSFSSLTVARNLLNDLARIMDDAATWKEEAESIAVQIQELSSTISSAVRNVDGDPERMQWLEDRKALLHKLKRKYGSTVEEILGFLTEARQRRESLESRGERIAEIDALLRKAKAKVLTAGGKLSKKRCSAALSLAEAVTAELRALGFAHGQFDVAVERGEPGTAGLDRIEFGFAPNVGETMRPLRLIASSGEISRVMLATKTVLASHDRIPVLVFDEIDTNVGGETGNAIGDKLATVAANHQVICITHLPQVAVHGRTHLVVDKKVGGGRTRTMIKPVDDNDRVEEVARMLGGRDLTSVTLKHAGEMLRANH